MQTFLRYQSGFYSNIFRYDIALMCFIALVFYGGSGYLLQGLKTTAAELPLNLTAGNKQEISFIARWSVNYRVHLAIDRLLPLQDQNCLLGIETVVPEKCAAIPTELFLSWTAKTTDDAVETVVAVGNSNDVNSGYWGPYTGKNLGTIPSEQDKTYKLLVNIDQSSPSLQQSNPRLIVEVSSRDLRWTHVWIGLLFIVATFSLALAAILLFVSRKTAPKSNL